MTASRTSHRIERRQALRGAAGAALALPFLPSLVREADAAASRTIKRFIFVFSSNGQRPENWYPSPEAPLPLTVVDASAHVREAQLLGAEPFSRIIGAPFNALKSKLLVLRGLDHVRYNQGGGHCADSPLTAVRRDKDEPLAIPSIDQLLAASSAVYDTPPPVRSAHFLVKPAHQSPSSCSVTVASGVAKEVPHEVSVAANYHRLFGGFVAEGDPAAASRRDLKLRTLDAVRAQYLALLDSPRLSRDDRRRLEAHATFVSELEGKLRVGSAACALPDTPADLTLESEANIPAMTTMSIDVLVNAIKCDRTRVATLMLSSATDIRQSSYLPGDPPGDHHNLSHDAAFSPPAVDALARINAWYGEQVATLLSKLDEVEDPATGATYLDNSVVYWGNEDGCNRQDAHWGCGMPVLLAGSLGGHFRTGRYVDYREVEGPENALVGNPIEYVYQGGPAKLSEYRGRLYNSLLLSIMDGMGLAKEEWERNGEPGYGAYGPNYADQYSLSDGQRPLPHLT